MKNFFVSILFVLACLAASSQRQPFKPLRYDENYEYLSKDTSKDWYQKIKYRPLSEKGPAYLSIGGEIRYQYFYLHHEDWGDSPADQDGHIRTRYLFHADLHTGRGLRFFAQLQSSLVNGKTDPSPVDQDELELHQGFAEFSQNAGSGRWLLRAGRQEMSFGSQRLVSVRELPNNRQSFDGIRSSWRSRKYQADVFYSQYVAARKGIFNDGFNSGTRFWGAYLTRNNLSLLQNIDLYYLGIRKKNARFDDIAGRELRHSIGSRIWSGSNRWQYDLEGVYQWGKVDQVDISAWTVSANLSYRFPSLPWTPRLGLKTELISGDRFYGDGRLNTFNPLFPKGAYFGLAALIGPSNLLDAHPYLELAVAKGLSWQTDYDMFWRESLQDGIYGPNALPIYSGRGASSRHIGQQLGTAFLYTPNNFLYLRGEFTWFSAGGYLKEVSAGRDILMAGMTVQLKF